MKKNKWYLVGMAAMVLVFGLVLEGCSSDGGGSPHSSKPAKLASGATAAQAYDKLNEIIGYSGTPDNVRAAAEALKMNWSVYSLGWSTVGPTTIAQINSWIDVIP
jgi:hypothetical protein